MHLFHCIKNDYQKLFCPPQILREVSSFPPNLGESVHSLGAACTMLTSSGVESRYNPVDRIISNAGLKFANSSNDGQFLRQFGNRNVVNRSDFR